MFDGGAEAVADIRQIAPREDYKTLLAGVVSKLHQLQPNELDHLIK
jgi:hypothetical protein